MQNDQSQSKKKGFFSSLMKNGDTDEMEQENELKLEISSLGKKYVSQLLKNLSRSEDDQITKDLFIEGRIREFQEEVKKYSEEDIVQLHNYIAQHLVKATMEILNNNESDQRYLTHIKTGILEFTGIAEVQNSDSLGIGLQKAVLSRINKELEKAASLEYKILCEKGNAENATEQDRLAPFQFLNAIDDVQAFKVTKLRDYLIKNHTKTQYV